MRNVDAFFVAGMVLPRCRLNKLQRGGTLEQDRSSKNHRALTLLVA